MSSKNTFKKTNKLVVAVRVIKQGFQHFFRNGWLSLAATTIMILTLFTISLFLILNNLILMGIKSVQEKIDLTVYLKDEAKQELVYNLQNDFKNYPDTKSLRYVSKEKALALFKEQNKNNPQILATINEIENPLPASFEIKVKDPNKLDDINKILDQAKYKDIIRKKNFQGVRGEVIKRLIRALSFSKEIGFLLALFFSLTSLIIIFNTVRITIFTRKKEIDTMKLIGATRSYIQWPFLIEGSLFGLIAAFFSLLLLYLLIYLSTPTINYYFQGLANIEAPLKENLKIVILIQTLVGVGIGGISSFFATRKYLKL